MTPTEADGRGAAAPLLAVFSVLWAGASVWHVIGNPHGASSWALLLVAAGVAAVLLRPGHAAALALLSVAILLTVWQEAPVLGNHWLLAGFASGSLLVAVVVVGVRDRGVTSDALAGAFLPAARLSLVCFYGFAGFAKLNAAFFDRQVSCAVFYFRESTTSLHVAGLQLHGAPWLETGVIWGTALVELSIPPLLLWRRTRHLAVVLAIGFHAVLALDRSHEFFDFSSVLLALFVLYLPDGFGPWATAHARRVPWLLRAVAGAAATGAVVVAARGHLPASDAVRWGWWPWQVAVLVAFVAVVAYLRTRPEPRVDPVRPAHLGLLALPMLMIVNGLSPYLELKTGYGWNMYANLRTVDGDSNHFLVRATLPVTDAGGDVVRIVETSDPQLRQYRDNGYGLVWRQLRSYLADHPDVAITYERAGRTVTLAKASDDPSLVARPPTWQEKLFLYRAVDLESPERCVPTFGPAR